MKSETLIIADHDQLLQQLQIHELQQGSSTQKLVGIISEKAKADGIKTLLIKITLDLIPPSYHGVAAMFAKVCEGKIPYKYIKSYIEDNKFMVLRCGTAPRLATFRARAIKACTEGGIYKCSRKKVPKTYRQRPGLFRKILADVTCLKIATVANDKTIAWKVLTDES